MFAKIGQLKMQEKEIDDKTGKNVISPSNAKELGRLSDDKKVEK